MSYTKNSPPSVVMKGKICYIDQNHFLYPGCKHTFFFCCKVGHFNMGSLWDWLFWSQPLAASRWIAVLMTSVWVSREGEEVCRLVKMLLQYPTTCLGLLTPQQLSRRHSNGCTSSECSQGSKTSRTHPIQFNLLPSVRRYRSLRVKTTRLQNSFFPVAIRTLNS